MCKKIVHFDMGNRFDNRQVNNFFVNQEVMSTCKNKFLLLIATQLQPNYNLLNYNSPNFKLVSRILGIFL